MYYLCKRFKFKTLNIACMLLNIRQLWRYDKEQSLGIEGNM